MSIYTPYTYHLYHKPTKKHYYGVRYGQNAHPQDLMEDYFTSSKVVHALIEEHGIESFDYQIRKEFTSKKEAIEWESKVLRRLNVRDKANWLNQHNGSGDFLNVGGYKQSEKTIAKKSGRNHYTARNGFSPQKGNVKRTKESKIKYSNSKIGSKNPRSRPLKLINNDGQIVFKAECKEQIISYLKQNNMPMSLMNYQKYNPQRITAANRHYVKFMGYCLVDC